MSSEASVSPRIPPAAAAVQELRERPNSDLLAVRTVSVGLGVPAPRRPAQVLVPQEASETKTTSEVFVRLIKGKFGIKFRFKSVRKQVRLDKLAASPSNP